MVARSRRSTRSRPRLSAADRGYGPAHRAVRAAAIAAYRPGQPCARCGQPLYGDTAMFDMGHVDGSGKTLYQGLEHRRCSRSAGATLGNRMRGQRRHWVTSRQW